MLKGGVIGYGGRIRGVLRGLGRYGAGVELAAITDVRNDEIRRECAGEIEHTSFCTDPDEMLDEEKLDGVLIGTRCSLHARMAIKVFDRGACPCSSKSPSPRTRRTSPRWPRPTGSRLRRSSSRSLCACRPS